MGKIDKMPLRQFWEYSMIGKLFVILTFSTVFSCASAQPAPSFCKQMTGTLDGLALSNCIESNDVVVLKYQQTVPASPYATEFDRRSFFIALSKDSEALFERIGMRTSGQTVSLVSTLLAHPPEQDQILHRQVSKTKIEQGDWVVSLEEIQYEAQGQVAGYMMECGTAIRRQPSTGEIIAASECFAYEDKERFFQTLSKVKLPDQQTRVPASNTATPNQYPSHAGADPAQTTYYVHGRYIDVKKGREQRTCLLDQEISSSVESFDKSAVIVSGRGYVSVEELSRCLPNAPVHVFMIPSGVGALADINLGRKLYISIDFATVRPITYLATVAHLNSSRNLVTVNGAYVPRRKLSELQKYAFLSTGGAGSAIISLDGRYVAPAAQMDCSKDASPGVWDIERNQRVVTDDKSCASLFSLKQAK